MTPPAQEPPTEGPASSMEEPETPQEASTEELLEEPRLQEADPEDLEQEPMGPPPLARLEELERRYGERPALGPVTLELPRGCVGLLGPNGAGKTTMIRTLMGLLPPSSGSVQVLGETVRPGAKEMRRKIGYVPEGEALFPGLTGVQAVVLAGRLAGLAKDAAMQRAHQVLDYVGLDEARYRFATGYSTGMRQRLKLAQALVHDPELLILDEPTEGVDPQARNELLDLIAELKQKHGVQVLLSTHLLHDIERLADYTVVLNEGRVVVAGPLEELRRPQSAAYNVRVYGETGDLERHLDKKGVKWRAQSPGLRVELDDPRKVLEHVQEAGLVVRHLAPVQLSLTDAYEEAVAKGGETNE
jgi:ABC-2 type transport system ATP-binding protein